jgi:hypothetical protein
VRDVLGRNVRALLENNLKAGELEELRRWIRIADILRGPFGSWPDLVAAGRMLMQLWLAMTRHGVSMLPFGSMITNSHCNHYLRERFSTDDICFILRLGYSPVPPKAPRLPSVLLGEDGAVEELQQAGRRRFAALQ